MYILVFIIKKRLRNWEVKRQIHVVAALCAELRGNAASELQPPSRERYRSLWRFRETKHLFSESWWNLFPFSCQEAEVGTAAESQLPSSPPAKTLGKELSHLKFQSFKVISLETMRNTIYPEFGKLNIKNTNKDSHGPALTFYLSLTLNTFDIHSHRLCKTFWSLWIILPSTKLGLFAYTKLCSHPHQVKVISFTNKLPASWTELMHHIPYQAIKD